MRVLGLEGGGGLIALAAALQVAVAVGRVACWPWVWACLERRAMCHAPHISHTQHQ